MAKVDKKSAIAAQQQHGKDTGSTPVQISILTTRINSLTDHLKTHKKDKHSRRGLLGLVGRRRRLLRYLQMNDAPKYKAVVKDLGLRA
ncbi:30S ribosomal protein S15 [Candidatus Peregrinibacteria bacterium]|nr:30S ribosomal protein S15 [bacterium]NCQ55822.1 30S ribosomal protein S15 [Candidatus Parcubacteria bacterium]NCS67889.1 30S ribosomal protein S15 [Candidatus Peregrinibacteria bacterium]